MSKKKMGKFLRIGVLAFCLAPLALPASAGALDVDIDPAPRIPLRPGDYQHFLVHLSGAKAACSGTVSFKPLPAGLSAEPAELKFALKGGEEKLLVFKVTNSQWGETVTLRPKVTTEGAEPVNFPDRLKTEIVRDRKMLDKPPVDDKGLLFYYSCGDGRPYQSDHLHADKAAGRDKMWDEGMWESPGGVKGKCIRGANGDMKSKAAFDPLNNVDHRRGTILLWMRKEEKVAEIPYWNGGRMVYDGTWRYGPAAGSGSSGEGIFGGNWTPQKVARRRIKGWKEKRGSDGFIGLRRYKAWKGRGGYIEAVYLALRQRRYSVRAPYDWTDRWRHVAVVWDTEKRKLEIHIDGKLASEKVRANGKPAGDEAWYGVPWSVAYPDNASFMVIMHPDEGGRSATRRDEFYIYNRAMSPKEIQANMRSSMGKVATHIIEPGGTSFHDSLAVAVRSHWGGVTHRYTLDGAEPDEKSPEYKGPITIDKTATVKVRSFMDGFEPSAVASAQFKSLGPDRARPKVSRVLAFNDPKTVLVIFDKDVQRASAEDVKNYALDGEVQVTAAKLGSRRRVVTLKTSAPLGAGRRRISIKGVKDTSKSANAMEPADALAFELKALPGLVAWWPFDVLDGPLLKDLGPLGIEGTAYRQVNIRKAVRVEGRSGEALYLRGPGDFADLTKYAKEPDSTNLDDKSVDQKSRLNTDEGSASFWLKAPPKPRGRRDVLYKKYAYTVSIYRDCLMVSGNGWRSRSGDKALTVADGKWHHVVLVFKNRAKNGAKLYIDGELKLAVTPRFLRHVHTRLQICSPVGWGGGLVNMDAAIDELMFFDRQLSEAEIGRLFKTGFLAPPGEAND